MIAVDTNVLVRFLVRDDAGQPARAAELIRSREIWISKTVLLETELQTKQVSIGLFTSLRGWSTFMGEFEVPDEKTDCTDSIRTDSNMGVPGLRPKSKRDSIGRSI